MKDTRHQTTVRLNEELFKDIKNLSETRQMSLNAWIANACRSQVNREISYQNKAHWKKLMRHATGKWCMRCDTPSSECSHKDSHFEQNEWVELPEKE